MLEFRASARRSRPAGPPAVPTTPDPIEIAMDAEASGAAPEGVAHEVLRKQGQLIGWQIASERTGLFLKLLVGVAALAAATVLIVMAWSAAQADGLLIDAFEAPPDLQAQGFTGPVLAAQLQDKLTSMQRETVARLAAGSVRENRPSEIRVQIPYAGVSLGELYRLLRGALGKETPVRGELVRLASGPDAGALALTVRVGADPGVRIVAKDGDVDVLLQRAAESVYENREPRRYLGWLFQHGRRQDALALATAYAKSASPGKRAIGLYQLSADDSQGLNRVVELLRGALAVDPRFCPAKGDLASMEARAGRYQTALSLWRERVACDRTERTYSAEGRQANDQLIRANIAAMLNDIPAGISEYCKIFGVAPCSGSAIAEAAEHGQIRSAVEPDVGWRLGVSARFIMRSHDSRSTARLLALHDAGALPLVSPPDWPYARAMLMVEREDWPGVLAAVAEGDGVAIAGWNATANIYRAYALARLGRRDEALAAAAATPIECYPCMTWRAKTLAALGDRAGAEAGFAQASALGPLLPGAMSEWAAFRLSLGDADGAIAKARAANRLTPNFADPLMTWGEALLAKGDAKGAAAKFAQAKTSAPVWGRIELKWGEALAKMGKTDQARAHWHAAAKLDLPPSERAELARVQGAK